MLKRFSEFTGDLKKQQTVVSIPTVENKVEEKKLPKPVEAKEKVKEPITPKVDTPKSEPPKSPEVKNESKEILNDVKFNGKIAQFPNDTKASVSFKILENNNIDKNKLHYIITEHIDNALVVVKYNNTGDMKLNDFVKSLIQYYMRNEKIKHIFGKIIIEGNENYSIIKNIPDVELNGRKIIKILNDDLINLLK